MTSTEEKKQKGRMSLLHDKETDQDKLTYNEYLKQISKDIQSYKESRAKESVPHLYMKIKREHPLMSAPNIRQKIVRDCSHLWPETTIRNYWPTISKDPMRQEAAKEGHKTRQQKDSLNFSEQNTNEQQQEREEENASTGGTPSWDWEDTHPKTEKHPTEWLVETNRVIARLFQLLTDKPNMPTSNKDIKLDIIKPTRPYIEDLVNGIPKDDRIFLHNWLVYLDHVIRDRIDIIEKADKTAYDTREDMT